MDKPDIEYEKPSKNRFGEPEPFDPEKVIDNIPIRPELLLDEKLIPIVRHLSNEDGYVEMADAAKAVEQIKAAFVDAGWLRVVDVSVPAITSYVPEERMTGPEWLARFERELKGSVFPLHCSQDQANVASVLMTCQEAAQRAAGVE